MTETREPQVVDPTDESLLEAQPDASPDEPTSFWRRAARDLKEAGEQGKQQWEQAITSSREFLLGAQVGADGEPKEGAVDRMKKNIQEISFAQAQDRGAELLLKLVTRVRKSLEGLEVSLEEARAKGEASASGESSGGTPVIA